ncbi:response regulator [Olleya sp. Bg11-27]|uniref:response regulator n=1 Tax=Olleya sp. Bg11-27 TaxID=2058135 RepID=UPI000C301EE2|nr:response regulator [Olleya sp. Bg11-27]AUC77568.1 DNA-binding response regulator [Olleya sp. Bg11-27]
MNKTINVLLVDDHPIIIEAYTNSIEIFKEQNEKISIKIDSANCCDTSIYYLKNKTYDVVFLDVRIPSSSDKKFNSGEDIALHINENFPKTKLIMITGHYDAFTLGNILQSINPIGLLFKGDVDQKIISEALKNILNNTPFYSATVLKLLRKNISSNIILDKTDKLLLMGISNGKKTNDLLKIVPLSKGGLEKRKRQLKELFGVSKLEDQDLINSAKKKGFL